LVSFSALVFTGHWEKITVLMWNCKKCTECGEK
jgi:hypothetical protein